MTEWSGVTVTLAGDPAAALSSLGRVVTVGGRARITLETPDALVIEDHWQPQWTRILSVALFPFGLVALAHRKRGQLTVLTQAGPGGTTQVAFAGEASRLITRALWQAIGQSAPGAIPAVERGRSAPRRGDSLRTSLQGSAGRRWVFAVSLALLIFGIETVLTGSSWDVWSDVVGNAVFALFLVGVAARVLGLWPRNRLINWRRVQLPDLSR